MTISSDCIYNIYCWLSYSDALSLSSTSKEYRAIFFQHQEFAQVKSLAHEIAKRIHEYVCTYLTTLSYDEYSQGLHSHKLPIIRLGYNWHKIYQQEKVVHHASFQLNGTSRNEQDTNELSRCWQLQAEISCNYSPPAILNYSRDISQFLVRMCTKFLPEPTVPNTLNDQLHFFVRIPPAFCINMMLLPCIMGSFFCYSLLNEYVFPPASLLVNRQIILVRLQEEHPKIVSEGEVLKRTELRVVEATFKMLNKSNS
jgi:hypothetical protein